MAQRAFFQNLYGRNGAASARNYHGYGNSNRISERRRHHLLFDFRLDRFDIFRFDSRRGVRSRAFFRAAYSQRLCGRGGFDSVFYLDDYFNVSDESVSQALMRVKCF